MQVKAYEVTICGVSATYNATSLGKAKAIIFRQAREHYPQVRFVDVRGRKVSDIPVTSDALALVMRYRDRPDLSAGAEVTLGDGRKGVVVCASSGACFGVLLGDGACLSVHPCDIRQTWHTAR